jgi:hypothetical protein
MPIEGETDILKFKKTANTIKAPYVIYADFESVLEEVAEIRKESSKIGSYTNTYQKHIPSGYTIYVTSHKGPTDFKPKKYDGTLSRGYEKNGMYGYKDVGKNAGGAQRTQPLKGGRGGLQQRDAMSSMLKRFV